MLPYAPTMPPPTDILRQLAQRMAQRSNLTEEQAMQLLLSQLGGGLTGGLAGGMAGLPPTVPSLPMAPMGAAPATVAPNPMAGGSGPIPPPPANLPPPTPQQTQAASAEQAFMDWMLAERAREWLSWTSQMSGVNPLTGELTTAEQQRRFGNAMSIGSFAPKPTAQRLGYDAKTGRALVPGGGTPGQLSRGEPVVPDRGFSKSGTQSGTAANRMLRSTVDSEEGEAAWTNLEDFLQRQYPQYMDMLRRGEDVGSYTTPEMRMYLEGNKQRRARQRNAV